MNNNKGRMMYYLLSDPNTIIDTDINSGVPREAVVIWMSGEGYLNQEEQIARIYEQRKQFHQQMADCYAGMTPNK